MKTKRSFNKKNFPKDARRITNAKGVRVWLYQGKEYLTKQELIDAYKLDH